MEKNIKKFLINNENLEQIIEKSPINLAIIKLMNLFSLNDRELSIEVGLGHAIIARLRTDPNVNPTIATILPIANYFSVTIDQIVNNKIQENEVIQNYKIKRIPIYTNKTIKYLFTNSSNTGIETIKYYGTKNADNLFCYNILTNDFEPFLRKNSKVIFSKKIEFTNNTIVLAYIHNKIQICKIVVNNNEFEIKSLKYLNQKQTKLFSLENILGILIEIIF
jgi:hypothetical protein